MVAPDQLIRIVGETHERDPHQRRAIERKARRTIRSEQLDHLAFLLRRRKISPVVLGPRQHDVLAHDLKSCRPERSEGPACHERRAEDRMTSRHEIPRRMQRRHHERPVQPIAPLFETRITRRIGIAKEQPLHRNERIDVLDVAKSRRQLVDRALIQASEREVRRRESARVRRRAVRDHATQRGDIPIGQRADRFRRVRRGAVAPAQLELSVDDERIQLEQMASPSPWPIPRARRLTGETEQRRAREHLIELAEIVEDDVGRRLGAQRLGSVEIAKHAVADAATRHRAKQLLRLLQSRARVGTTQRQTHGEDRREPSHRARQVRAVDDVFAPVPFDVDDDLTMSGPVAECICECGEKRVVDLRVVRRWHVLQQRAGLRSVEPRDHRARIRGDVFTTDGKVARQPRGCRRSHLLPIRQLLCRPEHALVCRPERSEGPALCQRIEASSKPTKRRRLRRQRTGCPLSISVYAVSRSSSSNRHDTPSMAR